MPHHFSLTCGLTSILWHNYHLVSNACVMQAKDWKFRMKSNYLWEPLGKGWDGLVILDCLKVVCYFKGV